MYSFQSSVFISLTVFDKYKVKFNKQAYILHLLIWSYGFEEKCRHGQFVLLDWLLKITI